MGVKPHCCHSDNIKVGEKMTEPKIETGYVLLTSKGNHIYDDRITFCTDRDEVLDEILRARDACNGSKGGFVIKKKEATLVY